jgi:hypothetical protein
MEHIPISKNLYQFYPFCFSLSSGCIVLSAFSFFPFCIKEEYKTNDSSTNRVADQHYFVKQYVHKFSTSPFYFQRLVVNPFYFDFFHYTFFLFFVGVLFLEIISPSLDVSLHFLKVTLIFVYKKAVNSHNFLFFNSRTFHSL